ncbi:MAG: hypothetical protein IJH38_06975 [Clostridia bacterium]|nr:hypothetical protein [Clostridia bacterium]
MNVNTTYDTVAFTTAPAEKRSFLAALRRFFRQLLKTSDKNAYGLSNADAARLYL